MASQLFFQILTAAGIIATAVGGVGSFVVGQLEAKEKELIASERIDQLETALILSVEENANHVAASTKEAVEENVKKQIKADYMREARKKYDERMKKRPSSQASRLTGH